MSNITRLSVNINKIATLRNARGGNIPNVEKAARYILRSCEADGITVHPRPDERHITYADVQNLANLLKDPDLAAGKEFNIEGNPTPQFLALIGRVVPNQVTLVPDAPDALTSSAGWDTVANTELLRDRIPFFHELGIRVSIFVAPDSRMVAGAKAVGADRVELYTEAYARFYHADPEAAIAPYIEAARTAKELGLGINAGHDLNARNLRFFLKTIPDIAEVSIGQALISDALYDGLEATISNYQKEIKAAFGIDIDDKIAELPF